MGLEGCGKEGIGWGRKKRWGSRGRMDVVMIRKED